MKKILLSLFVGFVGIISFCSSVYLGNFIYSDITISANSSTGFSISVPSNRLNCFTVSNISNFSCTFNGNPIYSTFNFACFQNDTVQVSCSNTSSSSRLVRRINILIDNLTGFCSDCPSCQTCTGYNFNVVYPGIMTDTYSINSDINLNVGQNISVDTLSFPNISLSSTCLGSSECPDGDFSGVSNFYVRHGESTWSQLTGTENYYVYLPEYLGYNYEYSNGTDLDFTVGVSVDTGFIDNVNFIQNSKPSQEDLNKLVSEVLPLFVPGLAVILLIYFIFRFIKKVF